MSFYYFKSSDSRTENISSFIQVLLHFSYWELKSFFSQFSFVSQILNINQLSVLFFVVTVDRNATDCKIILLKLTVIFVMQTPTKSYSLRTGLWKSLFKCHYLCVRHFWNTLAWFWDLTVGTPKEKSESTTMAVTARALKTQPALPTPCFMQKSRAGGQALLTACILAIFLGRALSWFSSPEVLAFSVFLALPDRADISSLLALEVCGFR